jgi:hypothetical protein
LKTVEKPYIVFCLINALGLFFLSTFSLLGSVNASFLFASIFIVLFFSLYFFYASVKDKSELQNWIRVALIILIGLILRIIVRYIFKTEQIQDFGRAHDAYLLLAGGLIAPAEAWTDYDWHQLYYSRFSAWFPHFAVTRLVYDIFGVSVRNMIILNYVLYAASAAIFYTAIKRLFSFSVAFCATAIFIFNPNLILWSAITSPDHFFIFLFCCMLYFYGAIFFGRKISLACGDFCRAYGFFQARRAYAFNRVFLRGNFFGNYKNKKNKFKKLGCVRACVFCGLFCGTRDCSRGNKTRFRCGDGKLHGNVHGVGVVYGRSRQL